MATSKKRLFYEYNSLAAVDSPRIFVEVHGVITELSSMNGKYFEGRLADDETSVRIVGFDTTQQKELAAKMNSKKPVQLHNCSIQKQYRAEDMEVVVRGSTQISTSPRKYDKLARPLQVLVKEVHDVSDMKRISMVVKVVNVGDREQVKQELFKQDVMVADETDYIRLTLWQEDIDKLQDGNSYLLQNVIVKSFNGSKYLNTPKSGLLSTLHEDLGDVVLPPDSSSLIDRFEDAEVVGVSDILYKKICFKCHGTVDELKDTIGVCSKCSLAQRIDQRTLEVSAKLFIKNTEVLTLTALKSMIQKIAEDDAIDKSTTIEEITPSFLMSKPFIVTYNGNVINGVQRGPV